MGIEKVLALQKEAKWDEMYEWLDDKEKPAKDQFLRAAKGFRVSTFELDRIFYFPPEGFWVVYGCASFNPPPLIARGRESVAASFTARQTAKGWRFSRVAVILDEDSPGGIRDCTLSKK